MKQFYESELSDITGNRDQDESFGERGVNSSRDIIHDRNGGGNLEKRRRDMRKDPKEKEKMKIWENIVKEAEQETESSDDDDHEI
eukprot:CAMPEP_0202966794 /NCGR_PEP_ID=MMETSP1396-20130829/11360_1 /ASSEMBLY_ACC=CAM_ASM_000872 /TAXON_ID= /ORGANISM="Pseudokeronopsis sp., Strain Brazil" /LENGTH=84 /DNA_ID=CAMNT_0049691057 /DNA_START=1238 /DNA_END=1492 /DNA_ORIENTATION=+